MNPEIIEISDLNSSNFGGGIELLMNDKKMFNEIKIDDLTNLENELNDLVSDTSKPSFETKLFSDVPFSLNEGPEISPPILQPPSVPTTPISVSKLGMPTCTGSDLVTIGLRFSKCANGLSK